MPRESSCCHGACEGCGCLVGLFQSAIRRVARCSSGGEPNWSRSACLVAPKGGPTWARPAFCLAPEGEPTWTRPFHSVALEGGPNLAPEGEPTWARPLALLLQRASPMGTALLALCLQKARLGSHLPPCGSRGRAQLGLPCSVGRDRWALSKPETCLCHMGGAGRPPTSKQELRPCHPTPNQDPVGRGRIHRVLTKGAPATATQSVMPACCLPLHPTHCLTGSVRHVPVYMDTIAHTCFIHTYIYIYMCMYACIYVY